MGGVRLKGGVCVCVQLCTICTLRLSILDAMVVCRIALSRIAIVLTASWSIIPDACAFSSTTAPFAPMIDAKLIASSRVTAEGSVGVMLGSRSKPSSTA